MANEKAKCACDAVLNRKKGATTGLRKHLLQGHKRQAFGVTSTKPLSKSCQLSTEQQKNFDSLTIKFIIEDGRNFTDMNKSGVLKVFDHLVEGYVPPHRYTVQRTLKRLESEYEASSINELSIVQSVRVTCDFWNGKCFQSCMCLTVIISYFVIYSPKYLCKTAIIFLSCSCHIK
ncbi:unnamed protein product [Adineta ricciae]|uniref:BED-type domain-containing protein n=1 Tax=Adineta ricciae TaxID=249248 RepID=A0A814SVC7_ADIRI|nr:unnamed protein product [Adineta ricciae]